MVQLKRVYEPASAGDGVRVLVDRLWPRGVSKESARIGRWEKDLAPSVELRKWFCHDPEKWEDFRRLYREQLEERPGDLLRLAEEARLQGLTLVFAAKDVEHCHALVLKDALEERVRSLSR